MDLPIENPGKKSHRITLATTVTFDAHKRLSTP